MDEDKFANFLKISKIYGLKGVARMTSNRYFDDKDNINYERKETAAEHVYSSLRLADYFLMNEEEFAGLDKGKIYDLILYHDDLEIEVGDVCISDVVNRKKNGEREKEILPYFVKQVPKEIGEKLVKLDAEFKERETPEGKFANAIDRIDAIVHELEYKDDWGYEKGWTEKDLRNLSEKHVIYSETFTKYFNRLIKYLDDNGYFED